MEVTAKLRYLRIAPRKVRLVADLIRGKRVGEAQAILSFTTKRPVQAFLKLLDSALANAKHNFQLQESDLYIAKIMVDEGPKYKRWMPRARGQAYEIQKKTSHLTLVLDETTKSSSPKFVGETVGQLVKKPEKIKKAEKVKTTEGVPKTEKPKLKPEIGIKRPKIAKGITRIFRRKAF